jgi:small-conductance mechanosensitive channel
VVGIAVYVALRWIALRTIVAVMRRLEARVSHEETTGAARLRTLEGLVCSLATYLILFLVAVTVLGQLGVNVSAILAGAGVVGLALSFGAQKLVKDILTGVFLLVEDQYRVGETVTLVGASGIPPFDGTVVEMGLRTSKLRDSAGKLLTISNGDISAVINHSRGPLRATIQIGLAPEVSLENARQVIEAIQLPEEVFSASPKVEGVTSLRKDRVSIRISAPTRIGAADAELALRQAVGEALRSASLEIR